MVFETPIPASLDFIPDGALVAPPLLGMGPLSPLLPLTGAVGPGVLVVLVVELGLTGEFPVVPLT